MNEDMINARIDEIAEAYATLPEMEFWDLSLEHVVKPSDSERIYVKAVLKKDDAMFEKIIAPEESLDFISETFGYSDTFTPRSKDISLEGLEMVYFDEMDYLVTLRKDSKERFKVKENQREAIRALLKEKIGKFFKG